MNTLNANSKRRLVGLREEIREKWKEKNSEMWSNMVGKIDLERDPEKFWKDDGKKEEGGGGIH